MKCKFRKICDNYRKDSHTCNKTNGFYFSINRPCRFYREFEDNLEKKKRSKKILKKLKKGKLSRDQVKVYLTPLGKIVAMGEVALRKREGEVKN